MRQIGGVIEELETIKAKRKKAAFSWKTGFNSLDKVLVSYREGDVVVVAGRPGMGKTAFCLSTILNVSPPFRSMYLGSALRFWGTGIKYNLSRKALEVKSGLSVYTG